MSSSTVADDSGCRHGPVGKPADILNSAAEKIPLEFMRFRSKLSFVEAFEECVVSLPENQPTSYTVLWLSATTSRQSFCQACRLEAVRAGRHVFALSVKRKQQ